MNEPTARAGSVLMTDEQIAAEPRCCQMRYEAEFNLGDDPSGWQRCPMPPFGFVDLETEGVQQFGLCLAHLMEVARTDNYIPIRPLAQKEAAKQSGIDPSLQGVLGPHT